MIPDGDLSENVWLDEEGCCRDSVCHVIIVKQRAAMAAFDRDIARLDRQIAWTNSYLGLSGK